MTWLGLFESKSDVIITTCLILRWPKYENMQSKAVGVKQEATWCVLPDSGMNLDTLGWINSAHKTDTEIAVARIVQVLTQIHDSLCI